MVHQILHTGVITTVSSTRLKGGKLGLSDFVRVHDPQRKKEAYHGGKIMRAPALYVSGRTR